MTGGVEILARILRRVPSFVWAVILTGLSVFLLLRHPTATLRPPLPPDARLFATVGKWIRAQDSRPVVFSAHPFAYLELDHVPPDRFEDFGRIAPEVLASAPAGAWVLVEDRFLPDRHPCGWDRSGKPERGCAHGSRLRPGRGARSRRRPCRRRLETRSFDRAHVLGSLPKAGTMTAFRAASLRPGTDVILVTAAFLLACHRLGHRLDRIPGSGRRHSFLLLALALPVPLEDRRHLGTSVRHALLRPPGAYRADGGAPRVGASRARRRVVGGASSSGMARDSGSRSPSHARSACPTSSSSCTEF